jgi:SAM-dependent methyltransferase
MVKKLRLFISPFFLTRFYQLKDIRKVVKKYPFKGTLIDIGCGNKPYKFLFSEISKYEGIDFKNYSINKDMGHEEPEYFFDKEYGKSFILPFKNNSFSHSVAFQVLEHHKDPQKMISEMVRITKQGGYIFISVPFLGGIHEEPNDFQRFTSFGLIELFETNHCKVVEVIPQGSLFSTISMLLNEYLNNFATKNRVMYILALCLYPPFLLFSYLSTVLDIIFPSRKIVFNYVVLAQK